MITKTGQKKIIPNRGGLTCNKKDSPQVLEGIRKWKSISQKRNPKLDESTPYWIQQSTCNAL